MKDLESVRDGELICEPHFHGKETVQVRQGFGLDRPVPFARWNK